ncbi:glycosyltransferase family A protein [Oceanivirga salmonicida]|uniref:glycosyltransferase family A protein n=1 Tax=Oceanivirga salmonicida TaxID=1769291 RepID=UPI00082D61E1|nr:glycosyltransferase family 2 protein [Oceanivirga salmonicida]
MKISLILTPNGKDVGKFLKTLKNQTIKTFELIVVDNANNSENQDIINIYKQYFNIKYINVENNSISHMRNKALFEISGEVISFPDIETIYMPNTIERVTNYLYDKENIIYICNDMSEDLVLDDTLINSSNILELVRQDNFFVNIKGKDIYLFNNKYKSNVLNIDYISNLLKQGYKLDFLYNHKIQTFSGFELDKQELKEFLKEEIFKRRNFRIIIKAIKKLLKRGK